MCASILVVDDSYLARFSMESSLLKAGYEVFLAEDEEEAMQMLANEARSVELVITDYSMPRPGAGVLLLHGVKRVNPELPVILVSAQEFEPEHGIHHEGFTAILVKSNDRNILVESVGKVIPV